MKDTFLLPQELDACHQLIEQLSAEREQLSARLEASESEVRSREAFATEQSRTVVELEESRQQLSQENDELKLTISQLLERRTVGGASV